MNRVRRSVYSSKNNQDDELTEITERAKLQTTETLH